MTDLYNLLKKIEKRPSMYLGKASITNLRSCISGYIIAKRELGINQSAEEREFNQFTDWIKQKFKIDVPQSWDKIILFFSEDEKTALNLFFELFNEFIESKKHQLQEVELMSHN